MKLSISTLGCPDWTFEQILTNFEALGVEGIEVRGIEGIVDPDKIPYFFEENKADTLARVSAHHLKFVGFGTSASFHDAAKLEANIAQCKTAIDVCQRMGIPAIRVFGNNCPEGEGREETLNRIGSGILEVCRYANDKGVFVNLEIHGQINSVENVKPILDICGGEPSFGIIWDVMHSDKTTGDDFEEFYQLIKPYIRHMHLKDHIRASEPPYKLVNIGKGDIPLKAIIRRVLDDGYDGYLSFEWEKKWHPELDEPEIAFPEFAAFMKELMKPARPFGLSIHLNELNDEFFTACRDAGVYSVEMSLSPAQYPTLDWDTAADLIHKNGLVINSVHLPFSRTMSISHPDKANRDASMELNCSVMRSAAAHGTKIAVVHPSTEPITDEERPLLMQYARENLRILADLAEELGMVVAVEDLPRTCLGRNSDEMLELLSADSRLRACFDTNHLLSQPIADCVRALGDKIITLHISDYDFIDERHLLPGELDIDWAEFMDLLDEIGYTGVFNYEVSGEAKNKYICRNAALTPEDYHKNYESLVNREKPWIPQGEILYR